MGGCVDGLCIRLRKRNVGLMAWPAYNLSFSYELPGTKNCHSHHYKSNSIHLSKRTAKRTTERVGDQHYKKGVPVNFTLPHFDYKLSYFFSESSTFSIYEYIIDETMY
jgi:hypothetical protein